MAGACNVIFSTKCCHEDQLDTTWFRLIENTNEACFMY